MRALPGVKVWPEAHVLEHQVDRFERAAEADSCAVARFFDLGLGSVFRIWGLWVRVNKKGLQVSGFGSGFSSGSGFRVLGSRFRFQGLGFNPIPILAHNPRIDAPIRIKLKRRVRAHPHVTRRRPR